MIANYPLIPSLPAADISRAKEFYRDKLDLKPVRELDDGAAYYETGGAEFFLYPTQFAGTNQATAAAWSVDDIDSSVAELKARGVVFEEYDFDQLKTVDGIATTPDGQRGAWFKDTEGNILAVFKDV